MRFGIHVFADEREAVEALLAAGFLPVGRQPTRHYRNPERDADRWVRRATVRRAGKCGRPTVEVHVWRAFTCTPAVWAARAGSREPAPGRASAAGSGVGRASWRGGG